MGTLGYLKDLFTVVTILSLVVGGLAIALKSGPVTVGPDHPRPILANLSQVVISLGGCLLVLGMIQQVIGIRLPSIW